MVTGKVVRFDEFRGYGFVAPDTGGEDVFIHVNDIDFDKHLLVPGIHVEFAAEEGDRGPKASRVRLLDRPRSDARPAPARSIVEPRVGEPDDGLCDVLSQGEIVAEFTEQLLARVPSLTGQQIVAVRDCAVSMARNHGWLEG